MEKKLSQPLSLEQQMAQGLLAAQKMLEQKDKQIEEMKNELVFTSHYGTYNAVAEHLYNKGYRKASDVAREIFEEIYEDCFDQFGHIDYEALAELKKKYESEGM